MKQFLQTVLSCALILFIAAFLTGYWTKDEEEEILKVGFVYSEDESTPYTANFVQAQRAVEFAYPDTVQVFWRSNVLSEDAERPLLELIRAGCTLIFINLDTEVPVTLAREYPQVHFCHISMPDISIEGTTDNYHTFNGEIYQARYVSGIVAGLKLRQMIDDGILSPEEALVGFVGANSTTEVISGYTAFFLGVKSVAPEAVMRVRYTGAWSNYDAEKQLAKRLIDEGCVIIAQHVNTMASAVACEEAVSQGRTVYHVGYHQSMMDVAPSCALVSIRTNWVPYVTQAVEAMLSHQSIEKSMQAHDHGRDLSAGFEAGWVELLELNTFLAPEGTQEKVDKAIEGLKKGKIKVFSGPYIGVNPKNPVDTIDLTDGFIENQYTSNPTFHYILEDCIQVEK